MEGPQYIVGRSNPPANGTPERRKVGKFHSKGLETSFQQSLRRSKHGGEAGPASINRVGGPGGEFAHPSKGTRRVRARARKGRVQGPCPSALSALLPSKIGPLVYRGDRPALSMVRAGGTGLWFKGSHMPRSCSRPALGARILGTFMPPPVSQVRAPQTGQVGMNSQTCQRGTSSTLHAWAVPICMTFL